MNMLTAGLEYQIDRNTNWPKIEIDSNNEVNKVKPCPTGLLLGGHGGTTKRRIK